MPFVHLPFVSEFGLSTFSSLHPFFMKGISYCVVRRKLEPLDRAKANLKEVIGLHDFRCYLRVVSYNLTPL